MTTLPTEACAAVCGLQPLIVCTGCAHAPTARAAAAAPIRISMCRTPLKPIASLQAPAYGNDVYFLQLKSTTMTVATRLIFLATIVAVAGCAISDAPSSPAPAAIGTSVSAGAVQITGLSNFQQT